MRSLDVRVNEGWILNYGVMGSTEPCAGKARPRKVWLVEVEAEKVPLIVKGLRNAPQDLRLGWLSES